MNVTVRPASIEEAELIHRLTLACWTGTVADNSSLYRETVGTVQAVFQKGGVLLAQIGGSPIGCARYFSVPHRRPSWEVKRLGVLRAFRKAGVGETLMRAIEMLAIQRGVERIQLGVRRDQPRLLHFYRGLGYQNDPDVSLSNDNPLTDPPFTLTKLLSS